MITFGSAYVLPEKQHDIKLQEEQWCRLTFYSPQTAVIAASYLTGTHLDNEYEYEFRQHLQSVTSSHFRYCFAMMFPVHYKTPTVSEVWLVFLMNYC